MSHQKILSGLGCIGLMTLLAMTARSSPTVSRLLGLSHRILSAGPPLTVELTIRPSRAFDSVSVESGSGLQRLGGDCHFSGVAADTPYVCRLELTGTASDAFMTLNVIGTSLPPGGGIAHADIQHLTFRNGSFQKARPTVSVHSLPRKAAEQ